MSRSNAIFIVSMLLVIIGSFLLLEMAYFSYFYIFKLTYYSVQVECNGLTNDELNSNGYEIHGTFFGNQTDTSIEVRVPLKYDTSWQLRNLYKETEDYQITLRHETIHKHQFENGRMYDCSNILGKYLNEVEAYTFSRSLWFYKKLY